MFVEVVFKIKNPRGFPALAYYQNKNNIVSISYRFYVKLKKNTLFTSLLIYFSVSKKKTKNPVLGKICTIDINFLQRGFICHVTEKEPVSAMLSTVTIRKGLKYAKYQNNLESFIINPADFNHNISEISKDVPRRTIDITPTPGAQSPAEGYIPKIDTHYNSHDFFLFSDLRLHRHT